MIWLWPCSFLSPIPEGFISSVHEWTRFMVLSTLVSKTANAVGMEYHLSVIRDCLLLLPLTVTKVISINSASGLSTVYLNCIFPFPIPWTTFPDWVIFWAHFMNTNLFESLKNSACYGWCVQNSVTFYHNKSAFQTCPCIAEIHCRQERRRRRILLQSEERRRIRRVSAAADGDL